MKRTLLAGASGASLVGLAPAHACQFNSDCGIGARCIEQADRSTGTAPEAWSPATVGTSARLVTGTAAPPAKRARPATSAAPVISASSRACTESA